MRSVQRCTASVSDCVDAACVDFSPVSSFAPTLFFLNMVKVVAEVRKTF